MAQNCGELEEGQRILKEMIDAGKADAWLAEREVLRKTAGQAAFVTMKKPLRLIAFFFSDTSDSDSCSCRVPRPEGGEERPDHQRHEHAEGRQR